MAVETNDMRGPQLPYRQVSCDTFVASETKPGGLDPMAGASGNLSDEMILEFVREFLHDRQHDAVYDPRKLVIQFSPESAR